MELTMSMLLSGCYNEPLEEELKEYFSKEEGGCYSENEKYLIFTLGEMKLGVLAKNILGVVSWEQAKHVLAKTTRSEKPDYFVGKVNINSNVYPLLDLRKRFVLEKCNYSIFTSVILFKTVIMREIVFFGVVVDEVDDVYDISSDIMPYESGATVIDSEFISAQVFIPSGVQIYLLDVSNLFKHESLVCY
jgi:purine-binding chemotaxis protein CheW